MFNKDKIVILLVPFFVYLAISFIAMDLDWVFDPPNPDVVFGRFLLVMALVFTLACLHTNRD